MAFDIDANGILHVSAKDKATGKEQKIRIEASSALSEADIEKMVKDAEQHAEEDKAKREEIEDRNRLDRLVFDVEKNSKEWSDQLTESNKEQLNTAIESAKSALREGGQDEIKKGLEELSQAYSAAGASIYEAAKEQTTETTEDEATAGAGASTESKDEDVVEGAAA